MGLVVWFLPQWHLAVTVPLAALAYFAVLAILRTFDAADFSLLVSLVSNNPLAPASPPEKDNEDFKER